jgi:hypothetical protein
LCVLKDQTIQRFQVCTQIFFARPRHAVAVDGHRYAQQDQNNADHHHHFDQREASIRNTIPACCSALHLQT